MSEQELGAKFLPEEVSFPVNRRLVLLVGNAAIGGFLFGYDTSSISAALIQMKHPSTDFACPGLTDHWLGTFTQETITALTTLGAGVAALFAGCLNDHIGRRGVLLVGSITFVIGAALMGLAMNVPAMMAARVIVGVGIGFTSHTTPCYISECCPVSIRGVMVLVMNVMIVFGQTCAAFFSTVLFYTELREGWRWMLGVGVFPGLLMFLGIYLMPESPRWLLSVGRSEDSRNVLSLLRDGAPQASIDREFASISEGVAEESRNAPKIPNDESTLATVVRLYWQDLHVRRALMFGCSLMAIQQLLGINTIMYYGASVLTMAEPSEDPSNCFTTANKTSVALNILLSAGQWFGILTCWPLIERVGRRSLFLSSLIGTIVGLACVGISFTADDVSQTAVVVSIMIYVYMFGFGVAGTPWVVNSEIYPLHVRARCIGAATAINWFANFLVSETFLTLAKHLSTSSSDPANHPNGVFFLYAVIGLVSLISLYFKMPETRGVSLEDTKSLFVLNEEKSLL